MSGCGDYAQQTPIKDDVVLILIGFYII